MRAHEQEYLPGLEPPVPDLDRLSELQDSVRRDFMCELRDGINIRQSWQTVPAKVLYSVWRGYADLGYVWNKEAMAGIADLVLLNILKLDFNTEVMGHKSWCGWEAWREDWEYYGITRKDYDGRIPDLVCDDEGCWRISDCGMDILMGHAMMLVIPGRTAEAKLATVDAVLNVCHMRSDMASWFVEGGSLTLTNLHDN